jgi:phage shock protein PspC (stress-responsive transcriptional regulator)
MITPNSIFKFSRNGQVYLEVELKEVQKHLAARTILPTDDYWAEGMAKWEKVYSRQWVDPLAAPPPTSAAPPVRPMRAASSFNHNKEVHPDNRYFSPYATFYRSQDDKWAYGIFGGLAHRNSWSPSLLFFTRLLTLIFVFPAFFYFVGWGLTYLMFTPALPTKSYKSFYDLGQSEGSSLSDNQSGKTAVKYFVIIILVVIVLALVTTCLSRR